MEEEEGTAASSPNVIIFMDGYILEKNLFCPRESLGGATILRALERILQKIEKNMPQSPTSDLMDELARASGPWR